MNSKIKSKLVSAIHKNHALLVYPLDNKSDPKSLWSELYPKSKMKWEWDQDGDDRVASLWIWREELSRSSEVVYSKWFKGRATFFSKESFTFLLSSLESVKFENRFLRRESKSLYLLLEEHSPQSTKTLKKNADLRGKDLEPLYQKSMKELFERGLAVAWGEKDEGAFPSLQTGATKHFFEEEWKNASGFDAEMATEKLAHLWGAQSPFYKYLLKIKEDISQFK